MNDPIRPDLIERFEKLNIPRRTFEGKYSLPTNFIARLKQGLRPMTSERGLEGIKQLEAALEAEEGGHTVPNKGGRPTKLDSLSDDDKEERVQLANFLSNAPDINTLDAGNQRIIAALLKGIITDTTARVLKEMAGERRQALIEKGKQEERAKSGDVLKVEIHNKADWSQAGSCPYCKGMGVLT